MVSIAPEAKLIPTSFLHQNPARTAVMTTMKETAKQSRHRTPVQTLAGTACGRLAELVAALTVALLQKAEYTSHQVP